jgi:hypothetical protein
MKSGSELLKSSRMWGGIFWQVTLPRRLEPSPFDYSEKRGPWQRS